MSWVGFDVGIRVGSTNNISPRGADDILYHTLLVNHDERRL